MNDNLVDITMILDRSASMQVLRSSTNEGFDAFVIEQRKVEKNVRLTLVQFDDRYEVVYADKNIHEVPACDLQPRGNTALLDAIGKTIKDKGKKFAKMKENERPSKVIFVILTDGEENCSKDYTHSAIKEMIQHQQDVYSWDFVYLGANQDAITVGGNLGIFASNCASYAGTGQGMTRNFKTASLKVASYAQTGDKADLCYSADDRKNLMGN